MLQIRCRATGPTLNRLARELANPRFLQLITTSSVFVLPFLSNLPQPSANRLQPVKESDVVQQPNSYPAAFRSASFLCSYSVEGYYSPKFHSALSSALIN